LELWLLRQRYDREFRNRLGLDLDGRVRAKPGDHVHVVERERLRYGLTQNRDADRLESEDLAFFDRVRAGYARRAAADPRRFARIDADQPREVVWAAVQQAVFSRPVAAGQGA
jgi:hypothetical protein